MSRATREYISIELYDVIMQEQYNLIKQKIDMTRRTGKIYLKPTFLDACDSIAKKVRNG